VDQEVLRKAALDLLLDARGEIAERSADVLTPEYWTGLCPEMTVGGKRPPETSQEPAVIPEAFARTGYFVEPGLLPKVQSTALVAAIERLRAHAWHPLFAFVFDEVWALAWTSSVRGIAAALLGPNPLLMPRLAVHFVDGGASRGWSPHVDGTPFDNRLTTWVALTDATLSNGCMYVVPRSEEVREAIERFRKSETTNADTVALLQRARALPAIAGSVLGWGFDILHWGSVSQEDGTPRVSVAYEWLGPDGVPGEIDLPLLNLDDGLPALGERLNLISRCILGHHNFDPALLPFVDLAEQIRSRQGSTASDVTSRA
jgi:hypothetical protein